MAPVEGRISKKRQQLSQYSDEGIIYREPETHYVGIQVGLFLYYCMYFESGELLVE